ncbi:MAG: hypothetical protein AMJ62_05255 [Myxococcales bacterium SG8_38]|nr:MAG: hypothetical protein AMJ62_05255 [Myxococcales bacterium SG8_38]
MLPVPRWVVAVLVAAVGCASPHAAVTHVETGSAVPFGILAKTVLGLVLLMGLFWLGSHPRVRQFQEWLGIRQAITAGFAFVGLGLIASHPSIGILSGKVFYDLAPLIHFALGWLGMIIGFQFDVRVLDRLPRGTALEIALYTLAPFVVVGVVGAAVMLAYGRPWTDATFVRDAIVLATAGAIFASGTGDRPRPRDRFAGGDSDERHRLDQLDEIAAVAGLAVLGSFFRPQWVGFQWALSGSIWLLITLGVGVFVGLLAYAILTGGRRGAEFAALTLGSVALASGVAGYLMLPPLVVCFIAGAMLVNLPGDHRRRLWSVLTRFERPLYYLFLTLAGALWDVTDWRGWLLVPALVLSRAGGYLFADRLAPEIVGEGMSMRPAWFAAPVSVVSIAIVISAQTIYRGPAVPWIVTAVLGSAIVVELMSHRRARR